tara:strand:- start:5341 stop:5733 length:393 start_codon:yes stop_codon:yes gene_type:complete
MENTLKIGKYSLIGLIWLIAILVWFNILSVSALISFSIALFWIIGVVTVGFTIFNFTENPNTGIKFVIGAVSLCIILGISFGFSDMTLNDEGIEIPGSQLTEAGIYTLNILSVSALVIIVLSEGKRLLKL